MGSTPKYQLGSDFESLSISGHKWYGGFIGGSVYILKGEGLAEGKMLKYQLMPTDDNCQIVMMPHVSRAQLCDFVKEYKAELSAGSVPKTTELLSRLDDYQKTLAAQAGS